MAVEFDKDLYVSNRRLPTAEIIAALPPILEAASPVSRADVVGVWVWVYFDEHPGKAITSRLSQLGFKWNKERNCWQHPCGRFCKSAPYDPRDKYKSQTFYGQ